MKAGVLALFFAAFAPPDDWPQFRGPGATGVLEDPALPDAWSSSENVVWKTPIPGRGWSSPIVFRDRIFLTSVVSDMDPGAPKTGLYSGGPQDVPAGEHRWIVYGLDRETGKIVWEREVHRGHPSTARHLKNSYASETPLADAERVYAYFGNLGVFAFDHDGRPLWKRELAPRDTRNGWGTGASPVLHRGRLYLVNDNEQSSYLLALDAATGKELFEVAREEKSNWSTPYVWENDMRVELVTTGTNKIRSYALDGKLLWEIAGMSSITIPTPFAKFGLLFVSSGYVGDDLRPVYAIRPGASGDASSHIAWQHRQAGPYNPSPIVYGDLYYTLYDRGFFTAHDARTGKTVYDKKRIDPVAGAFTASPWAYNGKIFCLSEEGVTYVIAAGRDFRVLGKNSLDEVALATPAIAGGSLFIRTASSLYPIAR
jgi:outer membrane protein assembly factor BamB